MFITAFARKLISKSGISCSFTRYLFLNIYFCWLILLIFSLTIFFSFVAICFWLPWSCIKNSLYALVHKKSFYAAKNYLTSSKIHISKTENTYKALAASSALDCRYCRRRATICRVTSNYLFRAQKVLLNLDRMPVTDYPFLMRCTVNSKIAYIFVLSLPIPFLPFF